MTKRLPIIALITTLFIVGAFFGVPTSRAITLIPPSSEFLNIKSGDTVPLTIKLFNETNAPLEEYSSAANFTALDESGTPKILEETTKTDLASWINVSPGPFKLQPGERVEIPVEIKVPENAEPGGHYAAILFSPQSPEVPAGEASVAISQKIGSLVLVRVAGVIREEGSIVEFRLTYGQRVITRLPVEFFTRFRNSGNVHLRPSGTITIRNLFGGTSAQVLVNSGLNAVLPQQIRRFDESWEKTTATASRTGFFGEVKNEWKNFALGSYSAELTLKYGLSSDKSANATIRFWVIPWHLLLVSALLLILVIIGLIFFIRRYNRWIVAKASQKKTEEQPPSEENKAGKEPDAGKERKQ